MAQRRALCYQRGTVDCKHKDYEKAAFEYDLNKHCHLQTAPFNKTVGLINRLHQLAPKAN